MAYKDDKAPVTGVLGTTFGGVALAAYLKSRTDISDIRNQRAETKSAREQDSQELHDQCKRNSWEIDRLKEDQKLQNQILEGLRVQCNELNVNMAVLSDKMGSLIEVIRSLKD